MQSTPTKMLALQAAMGGWGRPEGAPSDAESGGSLRSTPATPLTKILALKAKTSRRGFTFVELVIVILIMGILTAVAAPRYADSIDRYRAEAAAKRLVADLELARRDAKATSASRTVSFVPASESYTLSGINDPNHPSAAYAVDLTATGYTASLVSADFGGGTTITFDMYGHPDNGGTVVISSGGYQKTIAVNATTGIATIQ